VTPAEVARLIDHTMLAPDATRGVIEALCDEAIENDFATVCVNPTWTALCARRLAGSGVGVCTVVGFPLGASSTDAKQF
jgi:deoxyribose-phosphate aldolase